jgi:8-oxo-dGTP pyrophosphatase MutT (NUDIX family)
VTATAPGEVWTPDDVLLADARRVIAGAAARTPEERFERVAWDALLQVAGPRLLTRAAAPAHVTASALVLSPDATRTCLVLHGKIQRWVQPGGHLEPGDTSLFEAAAREVAEETGLSVRDAGVPAVLSRHTAPCAPGVVDWHLDVEHVLVGDPDAVPRVSDESNAVAWWPVDALPAPSAWGLDELVARGVAMLRSRLG